MRRLALLLSATLTFAATSTQAADWWNIGSSDQTAYDEALTALRASPGDPALLAHFANEASRIGNFEAAVGALEAILMMNPDLVRVRLELGVLYYRLRAYELSRFNIELALKSGALPEKDAARAQRFLQEDLEGNDGSRFSGYVTGGLRHDSNPGSRTSSDVLQVVSELGEEILVQAKDLGKTDGDLSVFGAAALNWSEDLGNQWGDSWDTTGYGYYREQFDEELGSLGYLRITSGPRLALLPAQTDHLSFRPYLDGAMTLVRNDFNSIAGGLGGTLTKRFGLSLTVTGDINLRYRDMIDGRDAADALLVTGLLGASLALNEDITLGARITWTRTDAEASWRSSDGLRFGASLHWRYDAPFDVTAFPWEFSLQGSWRQINYDAVSPSIALSGDRDDEELQLILRNTVGLANGWYLYVEGGLTDVTSNIPNYTFDNEYVSGGVTWRF